MPMRIAKIIAGAAFIAAPLSAVHAQSEATPDSSGSHRGQWIAGAGAAGATLFLTFAQSGHGATTPATQAAQPGVTAGPAIAPTGGSAPTPPPTASPDGTSDLSGETGLTTTDDSTQGQFTAPPQQFNGPAPMVGEPDLPPGTSTVPEPGSLALTATGIVGLLPLLRRRRR